MIDYKKFLDECQFGFELQDNGNYYACIKCATKKETIWNMAQVISYNNHDMFREMLYRKMDYCYLSIPGEISFYAGVRPDCDKFARHRVVSSPDLIEQGYEEMPVHWSGVNWARKWLSVNEYKALIIDAIETSLVEYADEIKNKELYREKGAVFEVCREND